MPASVDQAEEQDDKRYSQQQVDQAPGNIKAETEKPHDHNDYENRPKHIRLLSSS
jgi:hypothetical protein